MSEVDKLDISDSIINVYVDSLLSFLDAEGEGFALNLEHGDVLEVETLRLKLKDISI